MKLSTIMFSAAVTRSIAFVAPQARRVTARSISGSAICFAEEGQAEVVLVGCGAPNRGMYVTDDCNKSQ